MENPGTGAEAPLGLDELEEVRLARLGRHLTLNFILDKYMEEKRSTFADRVCLTADSIEYHLKPIRSLWGDMTLAEFSDGSRQRVKAQVEAWRRGGPDRDPWSPNTCRTRLSKLRTAFNYAVNEEIIGKAPKFKLPASGAPRERFVDPKKELGPLLAAAERAPPHIQLAHQLLLRLGCRKGALLKLRWEHVDFEERVIRLRDTQSATERKQNKKKRENQPMCAELFAILSEAKARARSEFVIEFRGKGVKAIYGGMKASFRRAGINDLTVHDLRRTSATLVYNGLNGDIEAAARHIADTKEMAERTYVQKSVDVKLPGLQAIGEVIAAAKAA